MAVVSTALASSYTYLSHGVVDTAAALLISCCAVLTAPLGANLTATLNAQVRHAIKRGLPVLNAVMTMRSWVHVQDGMSSQFW